MSARRTRQSYSIRHLLEMQPITPPPPPERPPRPPPLLEYKVSTVFCKSSASLIECYFMLLLCLFYDVFICKHKIIIFNFLLKFTENEIMAAAFMPVVIFSCSSLFDHEMWLCLIYRFFNCQQSFIFSDFLLLLSPFLAGIGFSWQLFNA